MTVTLRLGQDSVVFVPVYICCGYLCIVSAGSFVVDICVLLVLDHLLWISVYC